MRRVLRWWAGKGPAANSQRRGRGEDTAPVSGCSVETMHTDHLDWSLSAHRRGTLRGMDAA
ncbi:hypothetical protein XarbCFBP8138_20555 [Xanthomonas arboricola]|nr:hypothetical protein XarbCFBP8138_20555 [Xanthomonas arboricola]